MGRRPSKPLAKLSTSQPFHDIPLVHQRRRKAWPHVFALDTLGNFPVRTQAMSLLVELARLQDSEVLQAPLRRFADTKTTM